MGLFIDAVVVKGESRTFGSSIAVTEDNGITFNPLNLNGYSVRFRVLGAPTANAKVLIEKIITQITDNDTVGQINDAANGEFTFTITKDDTIALGLGNHPIELALVNSNNPEDVIYVITEGNTRGEYNKIHIVQV